LTREKFEVVQAMDGEEGLVKVKGENPDFVILDLKLPKMDGYHWLEEAKKSKTLKKIPVLILTAIDTDTSDDECRALGAVDYMVKSDYSLAELIEKVKKYI
jgi:two-component system, cell cycle response regulator